MNPHDRFFLGIQPFHPKRLVSFLQYVEFLLDFLHLIFVNGFVGVFFFEQYMAVSLFQEFLQLLVTISAKAQES